MAEQTDQWAPNGDAAALRTGWVSFGFGPRHVDGTYGLVPLSTLPSLEKRFDGSFSWLAGSNGPSPDQPARIELCGRFCAELRATNLELPEDLVLYLCCSELSSQVEGESVTGCWTDPSQILRPPHDPGTAYIRFLTDQQDCTAWYARITPGGSGVVALWPSDDDYEAAFFEELEHRPDMEELTAPDAAVMLVADPVVWVAPSVESFVYRMLLEGRIFSALHPGASHDAAMSSEMQRYLAQMSE